MRFELQRNIVPSYGRNLNPGTLFTGIQAYQIILEYLRVLAWPTATLSIVWYFRKELSALLNRIQDIKYKDWTLNAPNQITLTDEISEDVKDKIKETIQEKREEIKSKETLPPSPSKEQLQSQVDALLTQVATVQSAFRFERIYNLIFGTQIMTLQNLKKNVGGMWHVALASWYEDVRAQDPTLKNYPFSDYIGFLLNAKLIQSIESPKGRMYIITDLGTDFLEYIEKSRYPKFKPH